MTRSFESFRSKHRISSTSHETFDHPHGRNVHATRRPYRWASRVRQISSSMVHGPAEVCGLLVGIVTFDQILAFHHCNQVFLVGDIGTINPPDPNVFLFAHQGCKHCANAKKQRLVVQKRVIHFLKRILKPARLQFNSFVGHVGVSGS